MLQGHWCLNISTGLVLVVAVILLQSYRFLHSANLSVFQDMEALLLMHIQPRVSRTKESICLSL